MAPTYPLISAAQHLITSATGSPISAADLASITAPIAPSPNLGWLLTQTNLPGSTLVYDGPNAHDLYGIIGDGLVFMSAADIREEQECNAHWSAGHAMLPLFRAFHMLGRDRLFNGDSIACLDLSRNPDDPPVVDIPYSDGPSEHNLLITSTLSDFLRACRPWSEATDSAGNRWPN